jgi:ABC-type phosphate/phosphonate transport system substrate-binding protein
LFVSQDFLGSHDAVCSAVASGKADLGATFCDDPSSGPASHAQGCGARAAAVRVIASTQSIPNDALVVRAGFPDAARDALLRAAATLSSTPEGKKTLQAAFLAEGFAPTRQALDAFRR